MSGFKSDMERDAWSKVEALAEFHWSDLEAAGVVRDTAQSFVRRWEASGRIRCIRKDQHRKIYVNAERAIPVVPSVDHKPTPEGNMWRAMRRMAQFTPVDLAAQSNAGGVEVSIDKARRYCRDMLKAGYLKVRETAIPGRREARYQLIRNTGPQPPRRAKRTGVEDPNTGDFVVDGGRS